MTATAALDPRVVYWHREMPPLTAEAIGEHTLEAASGRAKGTFSRRDEAWSRSYEDLMRQACARLGQEVTRLGGDYARVCEETISPRYDAAAGEGWLCGRFTYVLYREPGNPA